MLGQLGREIAPGARARPRASAAIATVTLGRGSDGDSSPQGLPGEIWEFLSWETPSSHSSLGQAGQSVFCDGHQGRPATRASSLHAATAPGGLTNSSQRAPISSLSRGVIRESRALEGSQGHPPCCPPYNRGGMRALSAWDPKERLFGSLQSSPGGSAVGLPPNPPRSGLWHRSARAAPYHACRRRGGGGRALGGRNRGSPAARGSYGRQLSPFQSMQSLGGRSPAGCARLHPAAPLRAEMGGMGELQQKVPGAAGTEPPAAKTQPCRARLHGCLPGKAKFGAKPQRVWFLLAVFNHCSSGMLPGIGTSGRCMRRGPALPYMMGTAWAAPSFWQPQRAWGSENPSSGAQQPRA